MFDAIKKFQKIKTVATILLVVAVVVFVICLLGVHFIGGYVMDNYIVVSNKSAVQSKRAFMWEYTTVTGDMTLATATGNADAFSDRITSIDASTIAWSDNDYRGIIRVIASTWIDQGTGVSSGIKSKFAEIDAQYAEDRNISMSKPQWDSKHGNADSFPDLYSTSKYNDFDYLYNGISFKINSSRCCCCLAESFCEYMTKFDSSGLTYRDRIHTTSIGATESDLASYQKWIGHDSDGNDVTRRYFNTYKATCNGITRYIGPSLNNLTRGNTSITFNELIEKKLIGPGSILTFGSTRANASGDTTIPGSPAHIEVVVYIDDTYIYTAGAGNNRDIMMDAVLGYNSRWLRTDPILSMDFSSDGTRPVINVIFWKDSSHIGGS